MLALDMPDFQTREWNERRRDRFVRQTTARLLLAIVCLLTLAIAQARASEQAAKPDDSPQALEDLRLHVLPWRPDAALLTPLTTAAATRIAHDHLHSPEARSTAPGADTLRLIDQQRLFSGARLLRFAPFREDIEVFGERIAVLLDAEGRVRASSGGGRGQAHPSGTMPPHLHLSAEQAAAHALLPWGFDVASLRGAWVDASNGPRPTQGSYQRLQLALMLRRSATGAQLSAPIRMKPVWHRRAGLLRPAWYVETAVLPARGPAQTQHHASVVDAIDGTLSLRHDLSAHARFLWQTYAETGPEQRPQPGPQGRGDTPHPTGQPDGFVPLLGPPAQVELAHAALDSVWPGIGFNDTWLRVRDFETRGNNVDAYADLAEPDGFGEGDLRAELSGPMAFAPGYSPNLPPDFDKRQIEAGVVNAFYITNYLHDWFYAAGFDEAAGNAQMSNFDRGGLEFDEMRVETLDHSGLDNASMMTPADGEHPRMQLFRFKGPVQAALDPGTAGAPLQVQVAAFGPQDYRRSGALIAGIDSVANPLDGCEPLTGDYSGRVVLLAHGNCSNAQQALNAQAAGAIGVLIADTSGIGWPDMNGDAPGLNIPAQGINRADAQWLRERLAQAPLTVELWAERQPDRDAAMDAAIVAHEWGHYISNRLIGDGAGMSNHQSRSMGEGWADFHALLLLVREEDAQSTAGAHFSGSYGVMNYVSAGRMPSFSPNASYFGIRRYPYSTRREINPLEFQHIANNSQLPATAPLTPGSFAADNSAVHNAGEVWGSMLWDCYASLLRDTQPPSQRLSFFEAQRRMSEYLVAAYKLTPNAPTYTEARDALLVAMGASDLDDLQLCGAAFAGRGAGLRARSPSRLSLTLQGVQASRIDGGDLAVDAIELIETDGCDHDGILDAGEAGVLRLTLRNTGTRSLSASTVEVHTEASRLHFTNGSSRALPPIRPQQQVVAEFTVRLDAGPGREAITILSTPDDPEIGFETGEPRTASFAVDFDLRDFVSRTDEFDSPRMVWTPGQDDGLEAGLVGWRRRALTPLDWVLHGPDFGSEGQAWIESPILQVNAHTDFSIDFSARHSFEASSTTWYDGGVVEYSIDDGKTWQDVSTLAKLTPAYGGTLADCCDNPLSGRPAFVGKSAGWPDDFTAHRIDFSRHLAGQPVRLRFLIATDAAVSAPGWEIDYVHAIGIDNTPFPRVVPDAGTCTLDGNFRDGFETPPQ